MNLSMFWLSHCGSIKKADAALSVYSADEMRSSISKSQNLRRLFGDEKTEYLIKISSDSYLCDRIHELEKMNIKVICRDDEVFPDKLRQSEVLPPLALYLKGDENLLNTDCIGIVGTRVCSRYGKDSVESFALQLAEAGLTVVSGLATGIDAYAHEAALKGGKTIAVLGGGFDNITPVFNRPLARKIEESGLIVSEYPPEFIPTKYSFPERNRLISGLSKGILVIEAGEKSGSLITANFALEQNREIYALPGNINSTKSVGTNNLIKNGLAMLVSKPEDILSSLGMPTAARQKKLALSLDNYEKKIYNSLLSGERHFDELVAISGMGVQELTPLLMSLELRGVINRLPGNYYEIAR